MLLAEPCAPGLPDPALSAVPPVAGGSLVMAIGSRVAAWVWYSGFGSWPCGTLSCMSLLQKGFRCLSEQKDVRCELLGCSW